MHTTSQILIVEDDPDSGVAIVRVLQAAGYKGTETDYAEKAFETISRQHTDTISTVRFASLSSWVQCRSLRSDNGLD
jgi:DNA-binding response OmpR family regulator